MTWTRSALVADAHGLRVIEDAAQGTLASYDGRALGGIGDIGCLSFHETKNVICGEGGALLVNRPELIERAEILQEKGTNRSRFLRGQVDKYTWVDMGSSFLLGEVSAAFLWAQMEQADAITAPPDACLERYHEAFVALEDEGLVRRRRDPEGASTTPTCTTCCCRTRAARRRHRGSREAPRPGGVPLRAAALVARRAANSAVHTAGLSVTDDIAGRLLRLPLWVEMPPQDIEAVIEAVTDTVREE